MARQSKRGKAVSVAEVTPVNTLQVNEEALRDILLAENIKDLPVVVISIAGAYRTGKSFLLNCFLRYLQNTRKDNSFGDHDNPMEGFPWSRSSKRCTEGILLWSEVFRVTTHLGQEVAVLLMDTQGCFDDLSTKTETTILFAFSTMLSSVQVYNITKNIREDHLETIWLFTQYAQLARKGCADKPFQKLLFLVRDWEFHFEMRCGAEGGQQLLKRRLQDIKKNSPEMREMQNQFLSSFGDIGCFLMPHPGLQVIQKKEFCGFLEELDDEFREHLLQLLSLLLAPESLVVKKVNENAITCSDLYALFQKYREAFDGSLPTPASLLEANARQKLEEAKQESLKYYERGMEAWCIDQKVCLTETELRRAHQGLLNTAIIRFKETPCLDCGVLSEDYRRQLSKTIEEKFHYYSKMNALKMAIATKSNIKEDRASAPDNSMRSPAPGSQSLAKHPRQVVADKQCPPDLGRADLSSPSGHEEGAKVTQENGSELGRKTSKQNLLSRGWNAAKDMLPSFIGRPLGHLFTTSQQILSSKEEMEKAS